MRKSLQRDPLPRRGFRTRSDRSARAEQGAQPIPLLFRAGYSRSCWERRKAEAQRRSCRMPRHRPGIWARIFRRKQNARAVREGDTPHPAAIRLSSAWEVCDDRQLVPAAQPEAAMWGAVMLHEVTVAGTRPPRWHVLWSCSSSPDVAQVVQVRRQAMTHLHGRRRRCSAHSASAMDVPETPSHLGDGNGSDPDRSND